MNTENIEPDKQAISEIYANASDDARKVSQLILKIADENPTNSARKIAEEIRSVIKDDGE
jgi:hypothetical protein